MRSRGASRWSVVVAYALVAADVQMLWLSFAAITTTTAHRYGVSVATVGWLAEIFPLLYVVLAIPAGALLDRRFAAVLGSGAGLMALGAIVRLGGTTFAWAMSGQVMIAVAQPVILSAVTRLAGEYLRPADRADGIALGSAASLVGMVAALVLGPLLGNHGHLERLLAVEAALAVAATGALIVTLRAPGLGTPESTALAGSAARILWRMPEVRTLCALVFLGFGIFVAIATWLQTLLHPAGVSDTTAGAVLVGIVVAGVLGCGALAPRVSARRGERSYMLTTVAVTTAGCLVCALTTSLGARTVSLIAFGALLLSALPIVLTQCERVAGPLAGSAGAIVWLAGNLGGLVVALIVQALVHHPVLAFTAMALIALSGLPLAAKLPSSLGARDHAPAS